MTGARAVLAALVVAADAGGAGRGRRRHAARGCRARRRRRRRCAPCWPAAPTCSRRTATAAPRCTGRCIATTCRWSRRCCAPARGSTPSPISARRRSIWRAPTTAPRWCRACSRPAPIANLALPSGETPLMNCARTGDAAAVRALLARGARVDARESAHQQTALMWAAAERSSRRWCAALLSAKADRPRALASLFAGRDERGDAARRARGAELHRAARRQHAAPLCGAIGRRRFGAPAARRRRRPERRARRRPAGADAGRLQRPRRPWRRCCSTVAPIPTPPPSGSPRCTRRCCAPTLALVRALLARGRQPERGDDQGHADAAHQPGLRPAGRAHPGHAAAAGGPVSRARHRARAARRRRGPARHDAGRHDGADAGGRAGRVGHAGSPRRGAHRRRPRGRARTWCCGRWTRCSRPAPMPTPPIRRATPRCTRPRLAGSIAWCRAWWRPEPR